MLGNLKKIVCVRFTDDEYGTLLQCARQLEEWQARKRTVSHVVRKAAIDYAREMIFGRAYDTSPPVRKANTPS